MKGFCYQACSVGGVLECAPRQRSGGDKERTLTLAKKEQTYLWQRKKTKKPKIIDSKERTLSLQGEVTLASTDSESVARIAPGTEAPGKIKTLHEYYRYYAHVVHVYGA